jgi:hypothetical protein
MQQLFDFLHSKKMDYLEYFLNFIFFLWCIHAWMYKEYSMTLNLIIAGILVFSILTTVFKRQIINWLTLKIKLRFIKNRS